MSTPGSEGPTQPVGAPASLASAPRLEPGDVVGQRYVAIEQIGQGGGGVVFAAQDRRLDRKVALKFIRRRAADGRREAAEAEARLVREARAMAQLSHPNVLPIFEVDVSGRDIYLVMELVAGVDLKTWLRTDRRWDEILQAFSAAGQGLAAAHATGLVHRDFKPSNVLVGDDGRVRVMDFGLARWGRATGDEQSAPRVGGAGPSSGDGDPNPLPAITEDGTVMGTPAYMAPEQWGGEADARSDQYSFCVALHEALVGQRPSDLEAMGITPGDLNPEVPHWIIAAVRRGLSEHPDGRWPTMETLLDQLDRGRRASGHRWMVVGIGVVGLIAVATVGFASDRSGVSPCEDVEGNLRGVWDDATQARIRGALLETGVQYAEATWRRVELDLDRWATTWLDVHRRACEVRGPVAGSTRDFDLQRGCLRADLEQARGVVEVLGAADEEIVTGAVRAVASLPSPERCADPRTSESKFRAPTDPETKRAVDVVRARIAEVRGLLAAGKVDQSADVADGLLAQAEATGHMPLVAEARLAWGRVMAIQGDYPAAERLFQESYFEASELGHHAVALEAATRLVTATGSRQGRPADGHTWARFARSVLERGPDPAGEARLLQSEATVLQGEAKYEEAHRRLTEARHRWVSMFGDDHPAVAGVMDQQAGVLNDQGKYEAALAHQREALSVLEEALGPEHPDVTDAINGIAGHLFRHDQLEDSLEFFERALMLRRRVLGDHHPAVAGSHNNLALVLDRLERGEEAREHLEAALAIQEARLGDDNPVLASTLSNLGSVLTRQGRAKEALGPLRRMMAIKERILAADHPSIATGLNNLGIALYKTGDAEQALAMFERALAINEKNLGPGHPEVALALSNIGALLADIDRLDEAMDYKLRAVAEWERSEATDSRSLARSLRNVAMGYDDVGDFERAEAYFRRALHTEEEAGIDDEAETTGTLAGLSALLRDLGRIEEALELSRRAVAVIEGANEPAPHHIGSAFLSLAKSIVASSGDRREALELARKARAAFARSAPREAAVLPSVDAWIAEHSGR